MKAWRADHRLMRCALEAASRFHVFPVVPRGKTPAVEGWQSVATQDERQIRRWFAERPFNIGIRTGVASLLVVDLDDAHGEGPPAEWSDARGGWDVLARLAEAAGAQYPDQTYTVRTPTGGIHLYFRGPADASLRNTSGKLGWRIDTRGAGGYVVGAGSARAEGLYRCVHDVPIASLPSWLLAALTPPPMPRVEPAEVTLPGGRMTRYVATALDAECAAVAAARVHTRHQTLLRAARILGEFVGAGALHEAIATAALQAAARGHIGVSGFTQHQVDRAIADGLAYGKQRPRRLIGGR
jgi:hypothetical protein